MSGRALVVGGRALEAVGTQEHEAERRKPPTFFGELRCGAVLDSRDEAWS